MAHLEFFSFSTHLVTHLTSPHPQMSMFSSSGVLFASHTPLVARLTFPHIQTSLIGLSGVLFAFHTPRRASLACLVFFLLSTHLVARLTSPHTQTSLIGLSGVLFAFHSDNMAYLVSSMPFFPFHTPRWWASLTHLVFFLLFTWPWHCHRLPYLSTQPCHCHRPPFPYAHPDEPVVYFSQRNLLRSDSSLRGCVWEYARQLISFVQNDYAFAGHSRALTEVLHISTLPFHIQDEPFWAWLVWFFLFI